MSENKLLELLDLSFEFAVAIVNLVDGITAPKSSYMTDQLARAGTSVGANIHEAQYAQSKRDFVAKLEIAPETQEELRAFVRWVESNFNIPVTLWVDFEYKHYLIKKDGKRVGYLFYWKDFSSHPVFDNKDDIPQIRLPVRTEHSSTEEILGSFIEAITDYFAWICNDITSGFVPNEDDVDDILQEYLNFLGI